MAKDFQLSGELFEALLNWLDKDRENAGEKYENIRRSLIKIFRGRKCLEPEKLADETINRVAQKIYAVSERFEGEPSAYFFSIARFIYLEDYRKQTRRAELEDTFSYEHDFNQNFLEPRSICLNKCLAAQTDEDRRIVTQYYDDDENSKIQLRSRLAEELAVTATALRVRAFRIRQRLFQCMKKCLNKNSFSLKHFAEKNHYK